MDRKQGMSRIHFWNKFDRNINYAHFSDYAYKEILGAVVVLSSITGLIIGATFGFILNATFAYGITITIISHGLFYIHWNPKDTEVFYKLRELKVLNSKEVGVLGPFFDKNPVLCYFLSLFGSSTSFCVGWCFGYFINSFIFHYIGVEKLILLACLIGFAIKYQDLKSYFEECQSLSYQLTLIGVSFGYINGHIIYLFFEYLQMYFGIRQILIGTLLGSVILIKYQHKDFLHGIYIHSFTIYDTVRSFIVFSSNENTYFASGILIGISVYAMLIYLGLTLTLPLIISSLALIVKYQKVPPALERNASNNSETLSCHICLEPPSEAYILLECGHLPFCGNCSESITESVPPTCPVCREPVTRRIRAYF